MNLARYNAAMDGITEQWETLKMSMTLGSELHAARQELEQERRARMAVERERDALLKFAQWTLGVTGMMSSEDCEHMESAADGKE